MALAARRNRRMPENTWPGFVDALATLLMVIIFLLMIFVLAQFFLGEALSGRDEALDRLNNRVDELAELLSLERSANESLRTDVSQMASELQASVAARDRLLADLTGAAEVNAEQAARLSKLVGDVEALEALRDQLRAEIAAASSRLAAAEGKLGDTEGALVAEKRISEEAHAQLALANRQLKALQDQLSRLSAALDASEEKARQQQVQIASLGTRLNAALAGKVQELARYRSEFFGRLREALGDHPGIRIAGDRFVFSSEVLFDVAAANLGTGGREQMAMLAGTLRDVAARIPDDVDWILRVDGHTDRVPIRTQQFPSNWELSTARAIEVVRFLMAEGIPADRLAATGFGEYHPIDPADTPAAFARNRRIEIKLTER